MTPIDPREERAHLEVTRLDELDDGEFTADEEEVEEEDETAG